MTHNSVWVKIMGKALWAKKSMYDVSVYQSGLHVCKKPPASIMWKFSV